MGGSSSAVASSGFGVSALDSTAEAVAAAVKDASASLPDSGSKIAIVACTVDRDVDEVQREFSKALPGVPIHGLTSSANILQGTGAVPKGVGCLLITAPEGCFAAAGSLSGDAAAAAAELQGKMASPKAVIMSTVPGSEEGAIKAIEAVFPGVQIFGGTAADNELKGAWKVFNADGTGGSGVLLVAVGADVKFGASMGGPYTATPQAVVATKAEGRRVFEIDGKPASDWVFAWLGDAVKEQYENGGLVLPATAQKPIGIKQASGEYISLHLAALGGAEKYVDFFAPVPQGSELVVMDSADGPSTGYANFLAASYDTAMAAGGLTDPKAGILIYCGGMSIAVGENLDVGLKGPFAAKIKSLPMLGMTCFGEQACLPAAKQNVQRNLSLGMLLFQ
mmetsp:Transcript_38007/g.83457  ORF Transcript_38007/g.83457 Transcript_38007/m.83457 type:complete len:393 (+) Transcript_38007:62-1240(+)|eukprot:CAMPEP_0170595598 /NCGR_PEP_ID=MMETSP0224-20130122/14652_1 /TAXON_ID=285029 /ORGANISM="Togula jolla, Strain CCCM 725" /LENGTH=392 /DNA_ID=CAMNT_0010919799 /DNA_START=62 /DNA_END=1240 /DNA_ORIENTATION=-